MAKPISSGKSQELESKAIAKIKAIRQTAETDAVVQMLLVLNALADHAYAMGQPDLCFELQSLLLAKPSPNQP